MTAFSPAEQHSLSQTHSQTPSAKEWLSFRVADEAYCVDILRVQEIRSHEQPTRLAGAPAHVRGMLNLRGVIVPVIDLRQILGRDIPNTTDPICIVMSVGDRTVGAIVDAVCDVVELSAAQIRPVPGFGETVATQHLLGIGLVDDPDTDNATRTLQMLDIERLLHGLDLLPAAAA